MPFFDGKPENTDNFLETLDIIQSIIDMYGMLAPIKLCGDFSAALPTGKKLNKLWYRHKGYNQHSKILFDFLVDNDLIALDLLYMQSVSFTYFSYGNNHFSWIDRIFSSSHDISNVVKCNIVPLHENNLSDHLPVSLNMYIQVNESKPLAHSRRKPLGIVSAPPS